MLPLLSLFAAATALRAPAPRRPGALPSSVASASLTDPVPCCPPFGPTPPPPFPAKYETQWLTQPRDHFNFFQANQTFQQRYLYFADYWLGPPHPIVFVTCVEAGPAPYYWGEYGWVVDTLAKNLSALVVFAEHRGFGLTYPSVADGGDQSGWIPDAEHAGVLTEAQVLEDFTHLATHLRTNLSAWDSPLIAVGGSLAGEMATWWRVRYPFLVDMALSASAPILGFPGLTDQYGWYKVVTNAFRAVGGDACVDAIRGGFWQTAALTPAQVSAAFNTCTPASLPCHARQVADLVMYWTPTAAELGSYPATDPKRSLTVWGCGVVKGAPSGLAAYQRLLAPLAPGQCLNVSWAERCDAINDDDALTTEGGGGAGGWCATHWDTDPGCQDGWGIESCTTEIHPIEANNVTDFFPPSAHPFNETDRLLGCQQNYGTNLRVDGLAMPRSFGQLDLARFAATASRIIFSSGSFDPWSAQSINRTLAPTLPFVLIEGGAHHSDIGNKCVGGRSAAGWRLKKARLTRKTPRCTHAHSHSYNPIPTGDDTPALVRARLEELAYLNEWVRAFHEERKAAKAYLSK